MSLISLNDQLGRGFEFSLLTPVTSREIIGPFCPQIKWQPNAKLETTNFEDKVSLRDWQTEILEAHKHFKRDFLAHGEQIFVNCSLLQPLISPLPASHNDITDYEKCLIRRVTETRTGKK